MKERNDHSSLIQTQSFTLRLHAHLGRAVRKGHRRSEAYDHRGAGRQDRDWRELRSPYSVQSFCGAVHPADSQLIILLLYPHLKSSAIDIMISSNS